MTASPVAIFPTPSLDHVLFSYSQYFQIRGFHKELCNSEAPLRSSHLAFVIQEFA